MKKLILGFAVLLMSFSAYSQCTPNPAFQDSAFGVWPDTATGFPAADLNMMYLTQLDVKVPNDAGVVEPIYAGVPIDSGAVSAVNGLPAGIFYECLSHTDAYCTFLGDSSGCAVLTGTPTEAGVFPLSIELTGYITVFGLPLGVPLTFEGYELLVIDPLGLNNPADFEVSLGQNVPNPFEGQTRIPFSVNDAGTVQISISTLLGQEVYKRELNVNRGNNFIDVDGSQFDTGIYLYTITSGLRSETRKMILRN
ncbi:MAG: T9SS type A sorting domain-containing protein [Bacteroidota bacterium]